MMDRDEILYSEKSECYRVDLVRRRFRFGEAEHVVLTVDSEAGSFEHLCAGRKDAEEFFRNEAGRLRRKYGLGEDA